VVDNKFKVGKEAVGLQLRQAVRALQYGGIISYPTEAVFGLGCDPWNVEAVYRLLEIKQRSWTKGLILIAADFNQLQDFIQPVSAEILANILPTWPGPTTWLLPVRDDVPRWLSGDHNKIAVRVTAHKQVAALCNAFGGAIVSTSANIMGSAPARSIREVHWRLGNNIDYILPGLTSGLTQPTEIHDALTRDIIR